MIKDVLIPLSNFCDTYIHTYIRTYIRTYIHAFGIHSGWMLLILTKARVEGKEGQIYYYYYYYYYYCYFHYYYSF